MRTVVVVGALALPLGSLVVGCGDYSADPPASGGSSNAAAGSSSGGSSAGSTVIPGGSAGMGTGGSSAGAGGSSSGSPGTGGTGGRETPPTASCENVTPCGGEAAGVWFATSSCLPITGKADLSKLGIGCTEADVVMGKLDVTGNLTLGADGMMSDNTSTTGDVVLELAAKCLDVSGTKTICDRISSPLASAGFDTIECVDSTVTEGGCTCTGKVKQAGSAGWVANFPPQMGEWKAEANSLKLKTSDTDVDYGYCVEGNFMKVTPTTKNILGTIAGTVVFQKQQ